MLLEMICFPVIVKDGKNSLGYLILMSMCEHSFQVCTFTLHYKLICRKCFKRNTEIFFFKVSILN